MEVSGGGGSLGNLARRLTNTEEEEEEEEVSYKEGTQCQMIFISAAREGQGAGQRQRLQCTGRRLTA